MGTMRYLKIETSFIVKVISIIVGVLNILLISNIFAAYVMVFVEIVTLLFLFFRKKYTDYMGYFLIFYTLSMEFSGFVGTTQFYNFKNTTIGGLNLGIWFTLPLFVKFLFNTKYVLNRSKTILKAKSFFIKYSMILCMAVFMGLITILVNDNNVQYFPNLFSTFLGEFYTSFFMSTVVFSILIYLKCIGRFDLSKTINFIVAIIYGAIAQILISHILGIRGFYAGVETLMSSTIAFIIPLFPVILIYYFINNQHGVKVHFISIVLSFYCLFLSLISNANGKLIMLTILCPFCIYYVINKSIKLGWIIFLPIIPILLFFILNVIESNLSESILLQSKFNQVLSLFDFTGRSWFGDMASSPRFRVAEFTSIVYEYMEKPWYILFGKGVLGTIKDYTNSFGSSYALGTYSEKEWAIGSFYNMHFAPASFLLWGGLFGMYFYITTVVSNLKLSRNSVLLLVGTVWLAIYFGYSATLSAFGSTILMCGYFEIEKDYI